jgi:hypothetical protein
MSKRKRQIPDQFRVLYGSIAATIRKECPDNGFRQIALTEFHDALENLERAWEHGPHPEEVSYGAKKAIFSKVGRIAIE